MLRSATTSYYELDGLDSVTSLSNSAGALAQTYTFDSFGNQTAPSGSLTNPFQYTARESDTEAGLYYYRARYYNPNAGRFLSEDPLGLNAGMDFYSYVSNNPSNLVDPFGLTSTCGGCKDKNKNPINPAIQKLIDDSYKTYEDCFRKGLGIKGTLKDFFKDVVKDLGKANTAGDKKGN